MIASVGSVVGIVVVAGLFVMGCFALVAGAMQRHDPKPGRVSDAYLEELRRNPGKGAAS